MKKLMFINGAYMTDRRSRSVGFSGSKELKYWIGLTKLIFFSADTITIRLVIANASIIWALGAMFVPNTFERHGYEIVRLIPREIWIMFFLAHGVGVYWRIYDPVNRRAWGLAVNALGLAVWSFSTLLINMAIGEFVLGTSLEIVICAANAWTLYRTGMTKPELKLLLTNE